MRTTIVVVIGCILIAAPVCGDGGFIPPRLEGRSGGTGGFSSPGQKGIVIDGGDGTQLLILQTSYRGPAEDFAWIVPVPGLPPAGGVFAPDPWFIDMAFTLTQVHSTTDLRMQAQQTGPGFAGGLAHEGVAGGGTLGRVTLHRRMVAGDYDAAVLSASDEQALRQWLAAGGYAVSEVAADAFAHYISRGWYFVALKVRPGVARARMLLTDVQPIAIRFPTERLTYPLYISRASAPERTSLSLIVLAEEAVGCEQIGGAKPWRKRLPPGASWASIRLGMIGGPEPSMCCESFTRLLIPVDLASIEEGRWAPDFDSDRSLQATRMFTILAPDQMVDLSFDAGLAPQTQPHVHRYATVRDIFARPPWTVLLAGALSLLVLWRFRGPWRQEYVRLMAVVGVVVAVWGVSPATVLVLVIALVLLLHTEQAAARAGAAGPTIKPDRAMSIAIALMVLSLPVGWLALTWFPGRWSGYIPGVLVAGLMLAVALVLLVREALRSRRLSREPVPREAESAEASPLWLPALVATGWAAMLIAAGTSEPAPAIMVADGALSRAYWAVASVVPAQVFIFGPELLWTVAAVIFLRDHLREWPGTMFSLFFSLMAAVGLLYLLGVPVGLSAPGIFGNAEMLPGLGALLHIAALLAAISLWCFTLLAPFASFRSRRVAPGFAAVAVLLGMLVTVGHVRLITPAEAGSGSAEARAIGGRMDEALRALDGALERFADDTGAFPMQLSDLTAQEPPAFGLDGSGNRVPIADGAGGPWLRVLPIDPLSGRRDTWLYEVTGEPMVASGAYAIEVTWDETLHSRSWYDIRDWGRERQSPEFPRRITEGLLLQPGPQ